jgi:hypothetical protein
MTALWEVESSRLGVQKAREDQQSHKPRDDKGEGGASIESGCGDEQRVQIPVAFGQMYSF